MLLKGVVAPKFEGDTKVHVIPLSSQLAFGMRFVSPFSRHTIGRDEDGSQRAFTAYYSSMVD